MTVTRRWAVVYLVALVVSLAVSAQATRAQDAAGAKAKRPNVLFIAVDDLRPQAKCYGQAQMVTPGLDRLASRGVIFDRAYCQQAVCAPSRASLLTGVRPDTVRVTDLDTPITTVRPDLVTLPKHFRDNGYATMSLGKIYHHGPKDDPDGFSDGYWQPPGGGVVFNTPEGKRIYAERRKEAQASGGKIKVVKGLPYDDADVPDDAYSDGRLTDKAVEELKRLKDADAPFFLAVGYYRPHLPFNAPKKYWDLYDPSKIELADNPFPPKGVPDVAMINFGELRGYHGMPKEGPIPDDVARKLIHGYYASVSYTDAQVNRLLDELDAQGLTENMIVVLWGDHGWHLGEHGHWCKHTNFDVAARSPLLLAGPSVPQNARTAALTEFVDVYPTLCDLAGLKKPAQLEGTSLVPLLNEPTRPWKTAAFSQYPRRGKRVMGYSIRTGRYRFTRWQPAEGESDEVALELYDHQSDPAENVNLADDPAHADTVKQLAAQLDAGWRGAQPKQ